MGTAAHRQGPSGPRLEAIVRTAAVDTKKGRKMEWQPIETAPKDGTVIELLGENGKLDIGEWHEWSEHFDKAANGIGEDVTGEFSTEYGEGPHTHWRHLPSNY